MPIVANLDTVVERLLLAVLCPINRSRDPTRSERLGALKLAAAALLKRTQPCLDRAHGQSSDSAASQRKRTHFFLLPHGHNPVTHCFKRTGSCSRKKFSHSPQYSRS